MIWRDDPSLPFDTYEMHRVSYRVSSSCYHAVRTLQDVADRAVDADESIRSAIKNDFYVDDLMTGAATYEQTKLLLHGIIKVLGDAGFPIRKFASNEPTLITDLPVELREDAEAFDVSSPDHATHTLKILGVRWVPAEDCFIFLVQHVDFTLQELRILTKRQLLADILKLFDPIGWMAPVTLLLKAFMQVTWEQGLGWDDPLPDNIKCEFIEWRKHLVDLRKIKIQRCLLPQSAVKTCQLHVFCDASERGYGACIYLRTVDINGDVKTRLIMSKAKVSPVKQISIPRLELLAATVAIRLVQIVQTAFQNARFPFNPQVFAYSDSTTVLAWLSRNSRAWVTFVSNRVSAILEVIQRRDWYHVKTGDNPADLVSRGCHPGELVDNDLWWFGPKWIQDTDFTTPNQDHLVLPEKPIDMKPETSHCFFTANPSKDDKNIFQDLRKVSSLERTVRVTGHMLRFLSKFKRYSAQQTTKTKRNETLADYRLKFSADYSLGYITPAEATYVRHLFLQREQQFYFKEEIATLLSGKELHRSNKLYELYPFMDNGLLKVGGRLAASNSLSDQQKYPIIVSADSPISDLLIEHAHRILMHGTQQNCLAVIRSKYWMIKANQKIRKYIHNCVKCHRYVTSSSAPLMGDLPKERVTISDPWDSTGVDFAGPFNVRAYADAPTTHHDAAKVKPTAKKRKNAVKVIQRVPRICETKKAYMAIFVCFSSKAVHIEAVGDLSTASCIAAFNRFTARRGKPKRIFSDNGTNFVGSRNEIDALQAALAKKKGSDSLPNNYASKGVEWLHIPPRAPHFGGLWEAAVKSAKTHLKKVVGSNVLTFEELQTIFCQVEAIMNSRPLVQMSTSDTDYTALTPNMLITGKQHEHLPLDSQSAEPAFPSALPLKDYPQRRWRYMSKLTAHWWSRWIAEYLPTLQTRTKWRGENPGNWEIGELVLIAEDNMPPMYWPLARLTAVHTGNDGHIRAVRVRSPTGEYTRPVVKLRKLPFHVNAASP